MSPANDNQLSPEVEELKNVIEALEENAEDFTHADFAEVERLYNKLKDMVEGGKP